MNEEIENGDSVVPASNVQLNQEAYSNDFDATKFSRFFFSSYELNMGAN